MSSNSFNTNTNTIRKSYKYSDGISPSNSSDTSKRNVQKIVLKRKIQKSKDDKKTNKKNFVKLSPDSLKKKSFKVNNSNKKELKKKNTFNKMNLMHYKISSIQQKKKKSCMNKTVNSSNNNNSHYIEKTAENSDKKNAKKSLIQYITYIQLWWKTIYQIIKIQKYLRGYLYRIKLLKTLEINQKILYGLIGFSKLLKKIIFNNLIFSVYDMLLSKLKCYLHKWNEIITKKIIIKKLKNYWNRKKVAVKKNKTRKDNNTAIKNLIKKIKSYREVKKKHFKIYSNVINTNKKLSKKKHISKYSMLNHSLSKKNTNNSNKTEIGSLTPYTSLKNINNKKSSSAEKRSLNKKVLIKNNTNNHSMEKRIKQNKKIDNFNKEIFNKNYMNSLCNLMNSNIKKYMDNIRKKDSFGNCNFLSNNSINLSNSKVNSSYLMNYKSFCVGYSTNNNNKNNKNNKNIKKKLILNSNRALSPKKIVNIPELEINKKANQRLTNSARLRKRNNNKFILQAYKANHEKKIRMLKKFFIYWNNKTNKKIILLKLLGIFKIIKIINSIKNIQNSYLKIYQDIFFDLLYNKCLIQRSFNTFKNLIYLRIIISKLKTNRSYKSYQLYNNRNNGELHFYSNTNNYVYQANYTPILEISSDEKEKTLNSINSNNLLKNERKDKLLSLIVKLNNKINLSRLRNRFKKWKYITQKESKPEKVTKSFIKSIRINKRNTNNNNSYYLYQPNIHIDSTCFEDYLIGNKKNIDNNNFMNKTIHNYSEVTNNNTMSLISNTNHECFNTFSNHFYDSVYHKKKIVNYKYIANLTKRDIKIKNLSLSINNENNSMEGINNSNDANLISGKNVNTKPMNIGIYYPKKVLINNLRKNCQISKKLNTKTYREKTNIKKISEDLKELKQNIQIEKKNSFDMRKKINLSKDKNAENKLNKSF